MASLVDKAIGFFAPRSALARARARLALRVYEGAAPSRRSASWRGRSASANSEIQTGLTVLRNRARELARNTPHGKRLLDILVSHIVGTGIHPIPHTGSDRLDDSVLKLWDEWQNSADVEGIDSFYSLQGLAIGSLIESGEVVVRYIDKRPKNGATVPPFKLQLLESDFIDHYRDGIFNELPPDTLRSRLGVGLGKYDERTGLWLWPFHPGEEIRVLAPSYFSTFVSQDELIHLFVRTRPGQVRGVSWFSPMLTTARDYADFFDAAVVKARVEACFTGFITQADPDLEPVMVPDQAGNAFVNPHDSGAFTSMLEPGTIKTLAPGQDVKFAQPTSTSQVESIMMFSLMSMAAAVGVTYDQLSGDLRQANYSSLRAGKIDFRRLIQQFQELVVVPRLCEPIWDRFINRAILGGQLRDRADGYPCDWQTPAWESVNPKFDEDAEMRSVRAGRWTPQQYIGSWGGNWRKNLRDAAEFYKACDELDLVFDIDSRKLNRAGGLQQKAPGPGGAPGAPGEAAGGAPSASGGGSTSGNGGGMNGGGGEPQPVMLVDENGEPINLDDLMMGDGGRGDEQQQQTMLVNENGDEVDLESLLAMTGGGRPPALKLSPAVKIGKRGIRGKRKRAAAEAQTLYVRRQLLNGGDLAAWARDNGFATTLDPADMHVTVAFSKAQLPWPEPATDKGMVVRDDGDRSLERLGENAVVLRFDSPYLQQRWKEFRDAGASWDFDSYQPHVTLSSSSGVDVDEVEPYSGPLLFGREIFEPVDENWKDNAEESATPKLKTVPPHPDPPGADSANELLEIVKTTPPQERADWNEEDHPRDSDGKFTDSGGGDSGGGGEKAAVSSGGKAVAQKIVPIPKAPPPNASSLLQPGEIGKGAKTHPGEGYSKEAYVENGVIHTSNVYDAVKALSEDRKVELNQPDQVSTLLIELGQVSKNMIAMGKKAPVFNLCNVTVSGTNLFCAESKGIPRIQMPQLESVADFRASLEKKGYEAHESKEFASHLRATQNELNGGKVAAVAEKMKTDPALRERQIIVSKDNYVLDGHHTWAAKIGLDAADGNLSNDAQMNIIRVDIGIIPLLEEANAFTGGKGAKGLERALKLLREQYGQNLDIALAVLRDWNEEDHPRDEDGKFTDAGGGSDGGDSGAAAIDTFQGKFPTKTEAKPAGEARPSAEPKVAPVVAHETAAGKVSGEGGKKKLDSIAEFAKDNINVDSSTRTDSEKQQKFLNSWNEHVGADPAEFRDEFLGVKGTMNITYDDYSDIITMQGSLQDANDRSIGTYTRSINFKKNEAESEYFVLNSSERRSDVGKRLLAANMKLYQKLGIDKVKVHANIDVGGYAWAKYGYVPTRSSWNNLSSHIESEIDNLTGGESYTASSWDELSEHQQTRIESAWQRATHDEFYDSEVENWRESGQPLDDAKSELVGNAIRLHPIIEEAIAEYVTDRDEAGDPPMPFTDEQILAAISLEYRSDGEGRRDPDVNFDDKKLTDPKGFEPAQKVLPGIELTAPHEYLTEEMRSNLTEYIVKRFNREAESMASDMDPPDYAEERVREFQEEYWSGMDDAAKFAAGERYASDMLSSEEGSGGTGEMDEADAERLRTLAGSSDPKAVWVIADSKWGKELLLGSDWNGTIDLHDKETMTRFEAYVGKAKKAA